MNISHLTRLARQCLNSRLRPPANLEDRNIRLLYVDAFWQGVWNGGMATFLSVFMARLNADSLMISALTALPALITMLVSLPASPYVERQHNHVRTTVKFCIIFQSGYLSVAALPFFTTATNMPFWIVVIGSVSAIPAAIANVAWLSALGAILSPQRRPMVNGTRWALVAIFTAIFVALFGEFLDAGWFPFPRNYQALFLVSGLALFAGLFFISRIVTPVDYAVDTPAALPLRARVAQLITPMLNTPAFITYLLATFVLRLGMALPAALYSIFWVHNLGASDTIIGLRTTAGQVALICGYFLLGRLASRQGHRGILLASAVGLGLYPVATALSPTPIWLLPAAVLWGFFTSGVNISFFEAFYETAPPEKRPSFGALYTTFANLAAFVGPLLGSVLMEWLGIQAAMFIAGALHFIGAALCWYMKVGQHVKSL